MSYVSRKIHIVTDDGGAWAHPTARFMVQLWFANSLIAQAYGPTEAKARHRAKRKARSFSLALTRRLEKP